MTLVLRDSCDMEKLKPYGNSYAAVDGAVDTNFDGIVWRNLFIGEKHDELHSFNVPSPFQ